ncbi:MAG: type IV secretion protein IcmC [Gammaproteobacteria bacterium]
MLGQFKIDLNLVVMLLLLLSLTACSVTGTNLPNYDQIFSNLAKTYPALIRLASAFAYVAGFAMAFKAIYSLKTYGEARTMMSSNANIKEPIAYLIAAAGLIYSPTAYHDILYTLFGSPETTPLSYISPTKGVSEVAMRSILGLVQVVGVFAFIRGWFYLAKAGEQGGGQQNHFGKGMTHIIGGVLAINIVGLKNVLVGTLF